MIISAEEKASFEKYLQNMGESKEHIKSAIKPLIFSERFHVNEAEYRKYLHSIYDEEEGIYFECIDVEPARVYATNLNIDKTEHTKFRVAHYNERFHLYSVTDTGESIFLTTLNAYQMIKILNDEFYTERFYIHYYESLQES